MNNIGDGGRGGTPATVALDVLTLPAQALIIPPALAVDAHNEKVAKREAEENAKADMLLMPILERNPDTGLNERWDQKSDQHKRIFINSFSNTNVVYTDQLLEAIIQTCPSVRDCVFQSRSCSKDFLVRHFDEEFERGKPPANHKGLENIVKNPNTPLDLIEKVASANNLFASYPANDILYQRKSKDWMNLLENDSRIALKERWDIMNRARRSVFQNSFASPNVKYSSDLLEQIYQICPSIRGYVFDSTSCSKEFIANHFEEVCQNASKSASSCDELRRIVSNPNTPIDLVEKVASSQTVPLQAAFPAREILKKRRSEQTSQIPISHSTNLIETIQ